MGPKDIPDRWEPYIPIGSPVRGTRFIAFKVPLKEGICNKLAPKFRWTVDILLSSYREIGMVVDLTLTTRYYDYNDVVNKGVDYCKIPVPGQRIPPENMVRRFFAAIDFYLDRRRDDSLIGIHCTHGVNRTGYMIARYLIQRMGYSVSDALECITVARGHPIERENYVSSLGRNLEQVPKVMDGKDICRGRAEGEPTRNGWKLPGKNKDHVNRHGPARDSFRGRDAANPPSSTVPPWEPGRGPQSAFPEPREEGFHRPRRSEFVDESQFQATPVGYWGGGVHHPPPYAPGPRPSDIPPSQIVSDGRRDYRDEGRGMPPTGFDPMVPPPLSAVFPQQRDMRATDHEFNGRRPAHSEFVREEHSWPPAAPHRGYEGHGPPRDYIPHHSGRHSPPPGWQGPPRQGRYSPTRHRMSPQKGRVSPRHGDRYPPRRTPPPHSRMSPPHHGRRMSPPRGSPPRGHRMSPPGRRMSSPRRSPPRGRRMSPPRGTRGLTPPPPPRRFRTPPPPSRRSPSHGPRMSSPRIHGSPSRRESPPPRYGSPPRTFRPPSPRGGPMTPPYRSGHPVEQSPPRGHRFAPSERRNSPSERRPPPLMSRSPPPVRDGKPPPKYQGRRSPPRGRSPNRGRPDHLDMKYGPEIEPFPLARSPMRSVPPDDRSDEPSIPRSSNSSRTRRSRSPFRNLNSGRKPLSPTKKTSPLMRRSPLLQRSLSPRPSFHEVGGGQKGRRSPLPSGASQFDKGKGRVEEEGGRNRCRESPPRFDRTGPTQLRDWKEWKDTRDAKRNRYDPPLDDRPIDIIDLRSGSVSPPKMIDDHHLNEKKGRELTRPLEPKVDPKRSRPRTPEFQDVPRKRELKTLESVEPRRMRRTPDAEKEHGRGVLRTPEPQSEPRRGRRSPEPQRGSRERLRTPEPLEEPVRRRNLTLEPREQSVRPKNLTSEPQGESVRRGIRSLEPRQEPRRRGLRTPSPLEELGRRDFGSPESQEDYIRLMTPEPEVGGRRRGQRTPEPEEVPRKRPRSPEPQDVPIRRRIRSPDPHYEPIRRRISSPDLRGEHIRRRIRSPDPRDEPTRRGTVSPDPLEALGTPEPREDSIGRDRYPSPEPEEEPVEEPYEDPRSYGVLRTPEPLEEESRRGGPSERFERGNYRDGHPRYNRGGHFQGNRRPYNNYRGRMRGRGRVSRGGGPMRRDSYYESRTIKKPYLEQPALELHDPEPEEYHGYARTRSRSRSPVVIPREVPVMDESFIDEEPDCRELLIEKRTAAEIGALSPTALELIGPDDEILFVGSSSEQGNSRSSSSRRRPAASRLSPRVPGRFSRSPPPKKPVFERLDDNKPHVFERLDKMPEPRPLMEVRPRGPFESRGTGRTQNRGRGLSGHRPSRGLSTRPGSSFRSSTDRSSVRGIRSPPQGSSSSRGISSSRGKVSSRGMTSSRGISSSRGKISSSRGRISSSRGTSSTRGTSSRVLSSSRPSRSSGSLARTKKPAQPSEGTRVAPKKIQLSQSSEGVRRPTKTTLSSAKTGQSVSGKTAVKVSTKPVAKAGAKPSPVKKTRGAPRGRR